MIEHNLREVLEEKVTLDIEGIDRLYLNAYQPMLQTGGGVSAFFRHHRGAAVASTTLMAPMSKAFVAAIQRFAKDNDLEMVRFHKGRRKDDETQEAPEDVPSRGRGPLHRCGPGEVWRFSGDQETQSRNRGRLPLAASLHGDVQPITSTWWMRFSSAVHEVLLLLPYTARINLNGHEYPNNSWKRRDHL